jgi:hypothetical protein
MHRNKLRIEAEVTHQARRFAGVLAGNEVGRLQRADGTGRQFAQMPDRRADDI